MEVSRSSLLRHDLEESLERRAINPLTLSAFQRILLTTDGTVTEILEAFSGESIRVVKLFQEVVTLDQAVSSLELPWGQQVLRRTILLQGRMSLVNFIYAESIIALDRLTEGVRDGLLTSKKGIGVLVLEHRIETFKEILDCGTEPAAGLAEYFQIDPEANVIFRIYRMFSGGHPIMVITEKFPEVYFRDWDPTTTRGSTPVKKTARSRTVPGHDERGRITTTLEHFVRHDLRAAADAAPIGTDVDLFAAGHLDPRDFFALIAFIDERFGVRFDDAELVPGNFRTLDTIAERIAERRGRAAHD